MGSSRGGLVPPAFARGGPGCEKSGSDDTPSPRVFSSYRFFARILRSRGGRVGPSGRGRSIPGPRGPSALVPTALLQPSASIGANPRGGNFRIENAARKSTDNIRTNRQLQPRPRPQIDGPVVRGKTPESRMPFGEVPIKPSSANGGLAREWPREISPWRRSVRQQEAF
jgi:hypothetical protein